MHLVSEINSIEKISQLQLGGSVKFSARIYREGNKL